MLTSLSKRSDAICTVEATGKVGPSDCCSPYIVRNSRNDFTKGDFSNVSHPALIKRKVQRFAVLSPENVIGVTIEVV